MSEYSAETVIKKLNVSRETLERLSAYEALIKKWNPAINLVAKSTICQVWQRHFLDSAEIFRVTGRRHGRWADLGSGGGFPGAVIAILAAEEAPGLTVTCIESDIRKCEFLRAVARETGVAMNILSRRIEHSPPQQAKVVSARALAPMTKLLAHADRHMCPDGVAVFPKGNSWRSELETAAMTWDFDSRAHASATDNGAAILEIWNIRRA